MARHHLPRHRPDRPRNPDGSAARRLRVIGTVIAATALVTVTVTGIALVREHPGRSDAATRSAGPLATTPDGSPLSTTASPSTTAPSPSPPASHPVPAGGPKLLIGIGTEADSARRTALAKQAPVKMLTSWYNGPGDLTWMAGWRTGTVPSAYAAGYALHLVVWAGDGEGQVSTAHGTACGRGYPLSSRFAGDMTQLAQIFAGARSGPPLYVTLFTEFETYPCRDNAWSPDAATTAYYEALKDQYRAAFTIFHRYAPNARVSLGWGGWQGSYDSPGDGGGRSMLPHFADVLKMSDFQSFQAMDSGGNMTDIRTMTALLGAYGPVLLAHYKPDNGSQATFDADIRALFTDATLRSLTAAGLFGFSFMDHSNLNSAGTFAFVKEAVTRYAGGW